MSSLIQGSKGINLMHSIDEVAGHIAYIVKTCPETGEPTEEAQEAWLGVVFSTLLGRAAFSHAMHAGYFNNEGEMQMSRARNAPFMGPTDHMFDILKGCRDPEALEGLEAHRAEAAKSARAGA